MKLIAELYSDEILKELERQPLPRQLQVVRNVRAILKNQEGQIALAFYDKHNYHSLVGGGIEPGESTEHAVLREVREETGFNSKVVDEIGMTLEYRKGKKDNKWSLIITYCYKLETIGEQEQVQLTDNEKEIGFKLKWVSETEGLKKLYQDILTTEKLGAKRERDYLFLSHSN